MATKITVLQHTLWEGEPKRISKFVFEPGEFSRLRDATQPAIRCKGCDLPMSARKACAVPVYDDPFHDMHIALLHFCRGCLSCGSDRYGWFDCDGCNRAIDDHPSNMHWLKDDCSYVCTRCYREYLISVGLSAEDVLAITDVRELVQRTYPSLDLEEAGWVQREEKDDPNNAVARALLDGFSVLVTDNPDGDAHGYYIVWINELLDPTVTSREREQLEARLAFAAMAA